VIQNLRTTHSHLKKKKRRLTKRRDAFLTFIAPPSEAAGTGCRDSDLMEDLLDQMEDSPDEEGLVTTVTNVSV